MTEEHCTPLSTLTASLPKEATPCTVVQRGVAPSCKEVLHPRARRCCTVVQGGVARSCKRVLHSRARGCCTVVQGVASLGAKTSGVVLERVWSRLGKRSMLASKHNSIQIRSNMSNRKGSAGASSHRIECSGTLAHAMQVRTCIVSCEAYRAKRGRCRATLLHI